MLLGTLPIAELIFRPTALRPPALLMPVVTGLLMTMVDAPLAGVKARLPRKPPTLGMLLGLVLLAVMAVGAVRRSTEAVSVAVRSRSAMAVAPAASAKVTDCSVSVMPLAAAIFRRPPPVIVMLLADLMLLMKFS